MDTTTSTSAGTPRRVFLSAAVAAAAVPAAGLSFAAPAAAAPPGSTGAGIVPPPPHPQPPSPELRALLREVDPARIEATVRRLAAFHTRHTLSSQDDPHRGIGAARDWIYAQMKESARASGGRMTVEKQSYLQPPADRIPVATRITNVVATLHGDTDPNRTYVISGHYDSRVTDVMDFTSYAPGADDDASGVAVSMELARVMARHHFDATLIFAAVAGEEQGLYGSTHLANVLAKRGADVQGMFTNDIVGSSNGQGGAAPHVLRLFAEGVPTSETPDQAAIRQAVGGENDSPARQLARFVRSVADNRATGMDVRMIYRRDRYLRGGDDIPFLEQGWPAARFTEPVEDFRHQHQDVRVEDGVQYGDLPRFCDFGFIAGVARVNGATLWSLAKAPGMPADVRIDSTQLTNDTTLLWQHGGSTPVSGYDVLWRETTAPEWEHVVHVGQTTQVTLDISKDNVFFGVRAVGRNGMRSPAVFPVPQF